VGPSSSSASEGNSSLARSSASESSDSLARSPFGELAEPFAGNLLIVRSDSGDDIDPSLVYRLEPLSLLLRILVWDGADEVTARTRTGAHEDQDRGTLVRIQRHPSGDQYDPLLA
jgi:hypothetical protein